MTLRRLDRWRADWKYVENPPNFEEFSETKINIQWDKYQPHYNIAPSQDVPIARLDKDGKPTLSMVRWGLIPSWTKGKPKLAPINAKCETAATSGMFRGAMASRRCLVPADGFYEWKGAKPPKQPYFIHMKDDAPFSFAGLWERWRPEEGAEPVDTFTIITTSPNALLAEIHNRMPVILAQQNYERWLDRSKGAADVADLLKPYPVEEMEAYPVNTRVNTPRNDDAGLVERSET